MKIILKKDIVKERTSVKLSVLFALLFLTVLGNAQDTLSSNFPQYQDPVVEPVIEPYVSILNLCDDTHDFYFEFVVKNGYYKASEEAIEVSSILVYADNDYLTTINNTVNGEGVSWQGEAYKYFTTYDEVEFTFKLLDINYEYITEYTLVRQLKKNGEINASQRVFKAMFDWKTTVSSGGYTSGPPIGPTTSVTDYNYLFTYLCGQSFYKVELLAFIQEYFQLNAEEMCAFRAEYETFISTVNYDQSVLINWSDEFCDLLEKYWTMYKETKNPPNGGTPPSDCECKVINFRVTVDHSIGNSTSTLEQECREVFVEEGHETWWKDAANQEYRTDRQNNWGNHLWGYMGAAKAFRSHSNWERNLAKTHVMTKSLTGEKLKSGIQFLMTCIDPLNAKLDTLCKCTKEVTVGGKYVSKIRAYAEASGDGRIRSCFNDAAFMLKSDREGAEILNSGLISLCIECESVDSSNILTDAGELISSIVPSVTSVLQDSFSIDNLANYFTAGGEIWDAVDNFFDFQPACAEAIDTIPTLINYGKVIELTPSYDYVAITMSSFFKTRTHNINDESFHDFTVNSDYYLAGKVESTGDSTCCNELVGAYSIGTLEGIENDNLGEQKFSGYFDDAPLGLQRMQRDLAVYFFTAPFVEDVFQVESCCTSTLPCYYNCGYWGACHEQSNPRSINKTHSRNQVSIYPNPVLDKTLHIRRNTAKRATVSVYNIAGTNVFSTSIVGQDAEINLPIQLDAGIYIVSVIDVEGIKTQKILIK